MQWDHHRTIPHAFKGRELLAPVVLQNREGAIWFAPFQFGSNKEALICEVSHSQMSCHGNDGSVPFLTSSLAAIIDSSQTIWIGESTSLIRWRDGSAKNYPFPGLRNNTSQEGIRALAADLDGSLLVGISKPGPGLGLQRFRNGKWTSVTAPGFDGSAHKITALWFDKQHALWIGTSAEGIYRLYHGQLDHFDRHNGLSGNSVVTIFEDREGSLWVGTSDGIDQFRDLPIRVFSRAVYPRAEEFDNLVTTPEGTLWIGGDNSLYTLRDGSTLFTRRGGNLAGKQITTIFGDRAGRVWIGVNDTLNLYIPREGKFVPVKMTDGSPTGFIVSMAEGANGSLWALTTDLPRKILSIDPRTLTATIGLEAEASKIAGDPHGGLWVGLNNGEVAHEEEGMLHRVGFAHATGTRISQLAVMQDGALLATGEFGLAYLHDGAAHVLGVTNGLPCENINNLVFDGDGDLWLYAQCGLIRIVRSDFRRWLDDPGVLLHPRTFDTADGFRSFFPPFEGAARSRDGKLWFNRVDALQMLDPGDLQLNTLAPPVHIESFHGDSREYDISAMIRLPSLTRDIEIDYSALSFAAPEKVLFRYRLSGFDHEWHDAGTRRQAIYTNLRPGSYRFQVIAANNDNVWNLDGDTLSFTIPPRFYQTYWFVVCVALVLLALVCATFVVRLRISTRLLEGRMNERLMERDRIARELHDTFLQGFQGIVLRLHGIAQTLSTSSTSRIALEDTMDRADQILAEGRENLLQLRSNTWDAAELINRLNRVIADLQVQKFISCELSIQGTPRTLKSTVDEEIFAMAREALTNAFRHSGATAIRANLHFSETHFSFRCCDNGAGFPENVLTAGSAEGHWGLVGIRERATKLHARIGLRNNEPQGALVEIVLRARVAYAKA